MKLLVIVSSSRSHLYDKFYDNWKHVNIPPNVKVYFTFATEDGQTTTEIRNGNDVYLPFKRPPNTGHNDLMKLESHNCTITAYKWALENDDFDVVVRPVLTSSFHLKRLYDWLSAKPMKNHCFGKIIFNSFLSGCGYAMTRDVVERFVKWTPREIDYDDRVLGTFMRENLIAVEEWALDHEGNRPDGDSYWKTTDSMHSRSQFHLRFKTSFNPDERGIDAINHLKTVLYWNETP